MEFAAEHIENPMALLCSEQADDITSVGLIEGRGPSGGVRMMTIDLTNKVALVTGATGELGRVMARTLAAAGARVAVHYLKSADKAAALVKALPGSCMVQADVTRKADVDRMRDKVNRQLGTPTSSSTTR